MQTMMMMTNHLSRFQDKATSYLLEYSVTYQEFSFQKNINKIKIVLNVTTVSFVQRAVAKINMELADAGLLSTKNAHSRCLLSKQEIKIHKWDCQVVGCLLVKLQRFCVINFRHPVLGFLQCISIEAHIAK